MANKVLQKITHNWGLKLVSLILAIGLWLVVVNVEDPEMTSSFTVSVDVTNESYLANNDKVYEILDSSDTIRVSVTAKRSIIAELSNSDLQAVADLSAVDLNSAAGSQQIPIDVSSRRYSSRISLNARNYYLKVEIDNKSTKAVTVQTTSIGTVGEGFAVDEITSMPSEINISGPESIVDTISYAEVVADVSGAIKDFDTRLTPTFYDEEGNEVDSSRLTLDISDITVYVQMKQLKSVPVTFETIGTPAEGYAVDEVLSDVTQVTVMGDADALEGVTGIDVNDISVDGLSETTEFTATLNNYLPDGVSIYYSSMENVPLTVTFKESSTVAFSMLTGKISVLGLSGSQSAAISESILNFSACGDPEIMEEVEASDFTAFVDLSKYDEPGEYEVEVTVNTPEGVTLTGIPTITVTITGNDSSAAGTNDHSVTEEQPAAVNNTPAEQKENAN